MGNKVKFTMKNTPAGLSQINSAVLDTNYNKLWSGIQSVSGADVELDIGTAGTVGNGVWVYGDNASVGSESTAKVFGGYSLIEADPVVPPTGLLLEGDRLKVIAFGDSITEQGDNQRRNLSGNISKTTRSYWANALNNTGQDLYIYDGQGVASDTTADLLARMDDVLLTDVDFVIIMIGTNDLNQFIEPSDIALNMADILDQIIATGKKVVIQPTIKRRPDTTFVEEYNIKVDELNSAYRALAAARPNDVVVAGDPVAYNQMLIDNPDLVTNDGTHPLDFGAWLIGNSLAVTINEKILSTTPAGDTNYATALVGTTGKNNRGSTGDVPDGWILEYANPAGDVGGTVNGDGTFTVKTGLNTGSDENKSKVLFTSEPLAAGSYIFSIDLSVDDITKLLGEFKLAIRQGYVNENSMFRITPSTESIENSIDFSGGVRIILNRITIAEGEPITVEIEGNSKNTEQIVYTLGNPELRKVG